MTDQRFVDSILNSGQIGTGEYEMNPFFWNNSVATRVQLVFVADIATKVWFSLSIEAMGNGLSLFGHYRSEERRVLRLSPSLQGFCSMVNGFLYVAGDGNGPLPLLPVRIGWMAWTSSGCGWSFGPRRWMLLDICMIWTCSSQQMVSVHLRVRGVLGTKQICSAMTSPNCSVTCKILFLWCVRLFRLSDCPLCNSEIGLLRPVLNHNISGFTS